MLVKMIELLKAREEQKIADNFPMALGELSELIKARSDANGPAAVNIGVTSKLIEERLTEWAKSEGLRVQTHQFASRFAVCIFWGTIPKEIKTLDAEFLYDGKLVILRSH
jgi:hypothetical protein